MTLARTSPLGLWLYRNKRSCSIDDLFGVQCGVADETLSCTTSFFLGNISRLVIALLFFFGYYTLTCQWTCRGRNEREREREREREKLTKRNAEISKLLGSTSHCLPRTRFTHTAQFLTLVELYLNCWKRDCLAGSASQCEISSIQPAGLQDF